MTRRGDVCAPLLHVLPHTLIVLSWGLDRQHGAKRPRPARPWFVLKKPPPPLTTSLIHSFQKCFLHTRYFPGPVVGTRDIEIRHRTGPQRARHLDGDTHVSRCAQHVRGPGAGASTECGGAWPAVPGQPDGFTEPWTLC